MEKQGWGGSTIYVGAGGSPMMNRQGYVMKYLCDKQKKSAGFTLIELMVSMGLFTILSTIVIMSFVSFANIQARTAAMRDSQQKVRMALDQMTRQIKEASTIVIDDANQRITLTFKEDPYAQARYEINVNQLRYSECNITASTDIYKQCSDTYKLTTGGFLFQDMLASNVANGSGRILLQTGSTIEWNSPKNSTGDQNNMAPSVHIKLVGKIDYGGNQNYNDDFTLDTVIALEEKL